MEFIRPRKSAIGLDMGPLIDVIFLLLIFFMLSSSFLKPSMELKLPQAVSTIDKTIPEAIVVSAAKDGVLSLNANQVQLNHLQSSVKELMDQISGEPAVHVKGDKDMPYGVFVSVMNQLRLAGASKIHIVHEAIDE